MRFVTERHKSKCLGNNLEVRGQTGGEKGSGYNTRKLSGIQLLNFCFSGGGGWREGWTNFSSPCRQRTVCQSQWEKSPRARESLDQRQLSRRTKDGVG